MDKWIRTDELKKLPIKGKRVIVTDGRNVFEAYRRWSDGQWNGWHCVGGEFFEEPTHWQTLPEPPKQQS